jgi:Uma2 family endonuclease
MDSGTPVEAPVLHDWSAKVAYMENDGMVVDIQRKRFTVDEYYRMAEVGILDPDDRVELIEGEIIQMSPIGDRHAGCVNRATDLITNLFRGRAIVTVQNPVRLNKFNEPQPDLTLCKWRADFYSSHHPRPDEILLAVEVADTTLRKDLELKLPIYARLGIVELWIEDLPHNRILIFRNPEGDQYQTRLTAANSDTLSVLAFQDVIIKAEQLLG